MNNICVLHRKLMATKTAAAALQSSRGSAMVISLGITAILLVIATTIAAVALMTFRNTRDIAFAHQAFYAAEAGIEEALLELAGHKAGFTNTKTAELSNRSQYQWLIDSRLKTLPPSGTGTASNPDFNILPRNHKLVVNLFNDISCNGGGANCGFTTLPNPPTENVAGIDFQLYPLDDGIDLSTVLVGDTRITEVRTGSDLYQEDSLVATGDLDIGTSLTSIELQFVDLNNNDLWDPGEPVYLDADNNDVVSSGDIRLNTVAPNFRTCRQAYQPRRKPRDLAQIKVASGHCDSNLAMTNLDNDGDRQRDEDPVNGLDDDNDGLVDEDPVSWPLTTALFYRPSQQDPAATGSNSALARANIDLYANSPAMSWTISGRKLVGSNYEEAVEKSYHLLKSQLQIVASSPPGISLGANNFSDPTTGLPITPQNVSNALLNISEARLTIFSPLKGLNYRVALLDQNSPKTIAREMMIINATGTAGQSQQYLQTQMQQVESIPIFNFTITF